mgnify:CR=1 FL=1
MRGFGGGDHNKGGTGAVNNAGGVQVLLGFKDGPLAIS